MSAPKDVFAYNFEIFIGNEGNDRVAVHQTISNGNANPQRTVQGLNDPLGVFVLDDEIYTANSGNNRITVHDVLDAGLATPNREIFGNGTRLNGPCGIFVVTRFR